MTKPISALVDSIRQRLTTQPAVAPMVDDAAVGRRIEELAERGYIPSEQIIEPIRAYMSGYGILISGPAGTGKTLLMRMLSCPIVEAKRCNEVGITGLPNLYSWHDGCGMCLDDFGAEPIYLHYGMREELARSFIEHRSIETYANPHDPSKVRKQGRTCITTNLTSEQIRERYGDRCLSRIHGMCKCFKFVGESMREATRRAE